MDIFFADPTDISLPPEEVSIRMLHAEPWADGTRVQVYLEVDPFLQRPSAELQIINPAGEEVASVSVIESMTRKIGLTMHLRGGRKAGEYVLRALLFYADHPQPEGEELPQQIINIVDKGEARFVITE